MAAVLRERLLAKVTVIESGRRRTITVIDALVAKLIKGAFDGDSRAMDKLMKLLPLLDNDLAQEAMSARAVEEAAEASTAGDRAVLEALAGMLGGTLDGLAFETAGKPGEKADE